MGVSLPTGSGKTVIFLHLLRRIPSLTPDATKSLILVNTIELARQTEEHVRQLFPDWSVEIEQGNNQASGCADVYVLMYFFIEA